MQPSASRESDRPPAGPRRRSPPRPRSPATSGSRHAASALLELRVRLLVDLLQAPRKVTHVPGLVLVDEVVEVRPEGAPDRRDRERRVLRVREDLQERPEVLVRL